MAANRKPIPSDIKQAVMIEAGHRCAVCGESCPLERAHIIPWREVHTHSVENLICLCPNCHTRADNEKWGSATLRHYKENPWVMRRTTVDCNAPVVRPVTLRISGLKFAEFNSHKQRLLTYAIASFLGVPPESVEIVDTEDGSVIVTLELEQTAARRLLEAIKANDASLTQILEMFEQPESQAAAKAKALELCDRAETCRNKGDFETACDFFMLALKLISMVDDPKMEANICCNTGHAFDKMGLSRKAIEYHSRALRIEQQLGDEEAVAFHTANLGASYYHIKDYEEAKKLFLRAQAIYQKLNNTERDNFINWYLSRL